MRPRTRRLAGWCAVLVTAAVALPALSACGGSGQISVSLSGPASAKPGDTDTFTLAVVNNGCSHSGNPDESGDDSVSFDVNDPKIKERLGEDDGYALAIMYGADIHGSLETCG